MCKPNPYIILIALLVGIGIGCLVNKPEHRCNESGYKQAYLNYIEKIDSTTLKIK